MSVIGFDIGNETCYIAAARAGGIEVLDNEYSLRVTPLYVGFSKQSRDVGVAAKTKLISNIGSTIFNFKTLLGRDYFDEDTQGELSYLPYIALEHPSSEVGVTVKYLNEEVTFSIQQIMSIMLTKLKTIAEYKIGILIKDCVISVPVYFTDRQRRAMLDASEIAGLTPLQLVNESTAAALMYGYYRQDMFQTEEKIVVFVDFGQSALTVTACKYYQDKLSVIGSTWNTKIGGRNFDTILVQYFTEEFKTHYQIDVTRNKKALLALILQCEILKKQMSATSRELEINIDNLMNDLDVKGKISRERFESLTSGLLSNIEKTLKDFITQLNIDSEKISSIQLIGGSSRLPAFKNLVLKVFGKEPQTTLNQDEAVSKGCSLQCALISPTLRAKPFHIEDIQPYAIKVIHKTDNYQEEINAFNKFHTIPSLRVITFTYKGPFKLEVSYEYESGNFTNLGYFDFSNIPHEIQNLSDVKIKIKVSLDNNGIFNINSAKIVGNLGTDKSENRIVLYEKNDKEELQEDTNQEVSEAKSDLANSECEETSSKKFYELEIKPLFPKINRNDMNSYINKEKEMRENDLKARRISDLRNDIEEYIYYAREKIHYELSFLNEEDKNKLSEQVDGTESWLYETDEILDIHTFYQRLQELKESFEPHLYFQTQLQNVQKKLTEFEVLLDSSAEQMQTVSLSKHVLTKDLEQLKEKWNRANDSVRSILAEIKNVHYPDELRITPEMIQSEMKDLHNHVLQVIKLSQANQENETVEKSDSAQGDSPEGQNQEFEKFNSNLIRKDTLN